MTKIWRKQGFFLQPVWIDWRSRFRVRFFILFTIIVFGGTAAQVLTNATGHPGLFVGWWLAKLAVASLTVAAPPLRGADPRAD